MARQSNIFLQTQNSNKSLSMDFVLYFSFFFPLSSMVFFCLNHVEEILRRKAIYRRHKKRRRRRKSVKKNKINKLVIEIDIKTKGVKEKN